VVAANLKQRMYNLTMSCESSFLDPINLINGSNPY
jgi:hypothetical protein